MPYAFVQDIPGTEEIYEEVKARIGDETPKGMIAHVVTRQPNALRHLEIWESKEDWNRFETERLHPAVDAVLAEVGLSRDGVKVSVEEIDLVDVWLGDR
jgi:hypothetical protein